MNKIKVYIDQSNPVIVGEVKLKAKDKIIGENSQELIQLTARNKPVLDNGIKLNHLFKDEALNYNF